MCGSPCYVSAQEVPWVPGTPPGSCLSFLRLPSQGTGLGRLGSVRSGASVLGFLARALLAAVSLCAWPFLGEGAPGRRGTLCLFL